MSHKSPKELEAGMILAEDVSNLDGQALFKKGLSLSERHIEILMMWGIPTVEIDGDDEPEERVDLDQFSQLVVAKAKGDVNRRFRLVKSSHPAVDVVRNIAILQAAKSIHQRSPKS